MPDSAALSVLVLAWDEAAPAVRTVIEAAPSVGALLVLLPPAAPAPVEPAPAATPAPAEPAPAAQPILATELPPPAAASPLPLATAAAPVVSTPLTEDSAPVEVALPSVAAPSAAAVPAAQPAAQAPATATVRVLHLPATLPSARSYASAARVPAAPYLGATPASAAAPPAAARAAATLGILPTAVTPAPPAAEPATEDTASTIAPPPTAPEAAPTTRVASSSAPAAEAPATPATAPPDQADEAPLADMAFRADEIVDPDPMQELQATLPEQPAATPADAPVLRDLPPAPRYGPFGMRLPELAAEPAPAATPPTSADDEPADEDLVDELPPPAPQYSAPNLNTQIIHYARQAVPTALASGPFEVLYAPAWPTWLAAIELRQRSGRPLVLYLPALEADRQPADTAAGWPAEIQRQALRQADLVLVDTHTLARRLRRELGLAPSVVRVLPSHDAAAIARALRRAHRR